MKLYNFKILFQALLQAFSLNRNSPRFPSLKRILIVFLVSPLFILLFLFNWIFLLLDEIFFFPYKKQILPKIIFIIAIPRSATTYLLHLINKDEQQFTSPKLWELLFAPSIIQKYFFISLSKLNNSLGNPIGNTGILIDKILFRNTSKIKDTGLNKADEDEFFFLYNFSSLYLYFFFPGVKVLEKFVYHDQQMPESIKNSNLSFYHRLVQRHNYVFNRKGEKYYLSKNPTFIPRMDSIMKKFPQAKLLYPLRNPFETIPSTISLFANGYSKFCTLKEKYPMAEETRDLVIKWYLFAHEVMENLDKNRYKKLPYKMITQEKVKMVEEITGFLDIDPTFLFEQIQIESSKKKKFISKHKYDEELGIDTKIIKKQLKNIFEEDFTIKT